MIFMEHVMFWWSSGMTSCSYWWWSTEVIFMDHIGNFCKWDKRGVKVGHCWVGLGGSYINLYGSHRQFLIFLSSPLGWKSWICDRWTRWQSLQWYGFLIKLPQLFEEVTMASLLNQSHVIKEIDNVDTWLYSLVGISIRASYCCIHF